MKIQLQKSIMRAGDALFIRAAAIYLRSRGWCSHCPACAGVSNTPARRMWHPARGGRSMHVRLTTALKMELDLVDCAQVQAASRIENVDAMRDFVVRDTRAKVIARNRRAFPNTTINTNEN